MTAQKLTEERITALEKYVQRAMKDIYDNPDDWEHSEASKALTGYALSLIAYWRENEALANKLKAELAYVRLQRDALLEMTWLDLPSEPCESIAMWRKLFEEGWERKPEKEHEQKEPLCQHCGFPYGHHQLGGPIAHCLGGHPGTSWEPAP